MYTFVMEDTLKNYVNLRFGTPSYNSRSIRMKAGLKKSWMIGQPTSTIHILNSEPQFNNL